MTNKIVLSVILFAFLYACTPKVAPTVTKEETPPPPPTPMVEENLSPCKKFTDSDNVEGAKTAHVLYRDFMKQKQYDEAFPYWQKAYEMAPAADGKRDYHYLDGVKLYEHKMNQETDEAKKQEMSDRMMSFYDEAMECYPDRKSLYMGLKAFKVYYSFPGMMDDLDKYKMFKEVIDKDGKKTADFVVNPFTALMVDLYLSEKISLQEARTYSTKVLEIVDHGTKNCKPGKDCERWDIVKSYAPARLESMEGVEGFYDCAYYKAKYYQECN